MKLFLLFIIMFSSVALADRLELKDDSQTIFIDEKANWELGQNLFGIPFILFSPQLNGQRSNISFTDTGAKIGLKKTAISNEVAYKKMKKNWAIKTDSIPVSFLPYQKYVNRNNHEVHQIGFVFKNEGKVYVENSYYIECRGKVIFSKSLRLDVNEVHEKVFNELIDTLSCSGR